MVLLIAMRAALSCPAMVVLGCEGMDLPLMDDVGWMLIGPVTGQAGPAGCRAVSDDARSAPARCRSATDGTRSAPARCRSATDDTRSAPARHHSATDDTRSAPARHHSATDDARSALSICRSMLPPGRSVIASRLVPVTDCTIMRRGCVVRDDN